VPAASSVELRNDGSESVETMTLFAAPDAATDLGEGVISSVFASGKVTLAGSRAVLVLERRTLAPGDRLAVPPPPPDTFVTALVRKQAAYLGTSAGGYVNRDRSPMPIYVLTVEAEPSV
jgi:hypothetical protein